MVRHNFQIVFQNDILKGARDVCSFNHSVDNYHIESIYDLLNNNFAFPSADVIIGGFPCQDFSHCGKRQGFQTDKSHNLKDPVDTAAQQQRPAADSEQSTQPAGNSRGTLYRSFVEVVKRVRPKIFVAENVYGLLTMPRGDALSPIQQIVDDFSELGYDVRWQLVDCTKFGIPQTRKRVIIIGISKDRTGPNASEPLKRGWELLTRNKTQCVVGKYFEHLEEPSVTQDISQMMFSKAARLAKGQGQKEINLNEPAPTMRAEHHGNIEFRRHHDSKINKSEKDLPERRLTVREAGLIQTFPPSYIFTKKKVMTSYKYIGNAVPPLLGYLVANKVTELLNLYF